MYKETSQEVAGSLRRKFNAGIVVTGRKETNGNEGALLYAPGPFRRSPSPELNGDSGTMHVLDEYNKNRCMSTSMHAYELLSETSLSTRKASLYASRSALTRVRSVTRASSSNSSSAKRSGLYSEVTRRCWIASREKFTCVPQRVLGKTEGLTYEQMHYGLWDKILYCLSSNPKIAGNQ